MRKFVVFLFLLFFLITTSTQSYASKDCSVSPVPCTVSTGTGFTSDSCSTDCSNSGYSCAYTEDSCNATGDSGQITCSGTCTKGGGVITPTPTPTNVPINPCPSQNGVCTNIPTALGNIDVSSPVGFISNAFAILLSIAGAVAITIIILSGYRIMISQGNPEQLKGAREALTSAIIGLLFMIFSVAILQIIGVNILHIPGFK